jgi:hypothetical protein
MESVENMVSLDNVLAVLAIGGVALTLLLGVLWLIVRWWLVRRDKQVDRAIRAALVRRPSPPMPFWLDIARCEIHGDHTITTPEYWRCNCESPTYWPSAVTVCPRCHAGSDECADADVLALVAKYGSAI